MRAAGGGTRKTNDRRTPRAARQWAMLVAALVTGACTGGQVGPAGAEPGPRRVQPVDTASNATDTVAAPATVGAGEGRPGAGAGESDSRWTGGDEARRTGAPADTAGAPGFDEGRAGRDSTFASPAMGLDSAGPAAPEVLPVPILPGALLPLTRIVAFYGNPASTTMGILGELPPDEMLERLDAEVAAWREADPLTPVKPALQIIAVMATGDPGRDSLFRLRMPDRRIQEVSDWARRRNALLFLDVQPGRSTVEEELPPLEAWLTRPDVHLALDPEWAMPPDGVPGRQIGSLTAGDINFAIDWLADIVERYHLPPKVLVVHRFTSSMVQRAEEIRRNPRVQVVINMDGWGRPPHKRAAYRDIVAPEADQFTGLKLFFHNDRRDGSVLLTPSEILELHPAPLYIQYQ